MYKQQIIDAIQNQQWLQITFRREKDDVDVIRVVAPYDVFPQRDKKHQGEDRLLGYTKTHENYQPGVISLYLNNILGIFESGEHFDGPIIRRLIDPKESPCISREW